MLGNAWYALLQHPEQWRLLHEHPELTEQAVEEFVPAFQRLIGSVARERGFRTPTRESLMQDVGPGGESTLLIDDLLDLLLARREPSGDLERDDVMQVLRQMRAPA